MPEHPTTRLPPSPPAEPSPRPQRQEDHEPPAFESDLDRHSASVDEVYGSHGVQPDLAETAFRPGAGRGSVGLSRVGERRR